LLGRLKRLRGDGLEHQLPDLEAMLPAAVGDRPLRRWSVRGADHFAGTRLTAEALEELEADLAADGLGIDDVGMAVAGRSDAGKDPPYFVFAFRFRTIPADTLPPVIGVQHPEAASWTSTTLGRRDVKVGTEAMFEQTEHFRGRPYVYNVGDVRFVVTTDDEAWASDAVARLRPDPLVERVTHLVNLPAGWRPGPSPRATDSAIASLRGDPDCLAVAHDGSMVGHAFVPSLQILHQGPADSGYVDGFLNSQEREFREGIASDAEVRAAIRSLDRADLPAGTALRVVLVTEDPEVPGGIAQVQFYVSTNTGPFGLWFACAASDLSYCQDTFDRTARTFMRTGVDPGGVLQPSDRVDPREREDHEELTDRP
jgi:hypothetical protein